MNDDYNTFNNSNFAETADFLRIQNVSPRKETARYTGYDVSISDIMSRHNAFLHVPNYCENS